MKKMTLSTLALLVMTASAFTLRNGRAAESFFGNPAMATNGAFRDGLHLGKLAGQSGDGYRVATARWVNPNDRASFASGYDQGYKARVTLRAAK